MKHFNQLNAVDTQVCRLGEMHKLFRVICNGADTSSLEELRSAIHYIEGSLDDIAESLQKDFQTLFEIIARESEDEDNGIG